MPQFSRPPYISAKLTCYIMQYMLLDMLFNSVRKVNISVRKVNLSVGFVSKYKTEDTLHLGCTCLKVLHLTRMYNFYTIFSYTVSYTSCILYYTILYFYNILQSYNLSYSFSHPILYMILIHPISLIFPTLFVSLDTAQK